MQIRTLEQQFQDDFTPDALPMGCVDTTDFTEVEPIAFGFRALLSKCGGGSFRKGLYRLHMPDGIRRWTAIVQDSFPEYRDRLLCFGYDWLGRHFALDKMHLVDQQAQILLFDPGFHEVLEIPCSFDEFHRIELAEYTDDVLAATFYSAWLGSGGSTPSVSECVGYRVPPTLGGEDEVSNLEVIDMDVYWTLS